MYSTQTFGFVKRTHALGLLDLTATASARTARAPARSNAERFSGAAHTNAELDAWARHAAAANGFGNAVVAPFAFELMHAARAARSRAISAAIADLARRFVRNVTVAVATWRAKRLAYVTSRDLAGLDARTLRDIGFDRSELLSVGYEVAGLSQRQRVHALRSPQ
jgi:uncharacterized protein YjiS (DUF1127 family)